MNFLKNKLAVTIVILSVTFLILITYSIKRENVSVVENGIGITLNSVQSLVYNVNSKIKDSFSFISNISKIKKENEELIKRNIELENKLIDYNTLKSENDRLRGVVNFANQRSEYNYIGCDIIGKSGGGLLDQFMINKGSKDGIEKDMIAITDQGLVGQVISVGTNWGIIESLSNENLQVSGMIESTGENSGIVKGYKNSENQLLAKLYYLPIDSSVKNGDIILTSGLGKIYPKGIRIGYVTDVEEVKGKVEKNATIQPYVDLNKIEEVFIVVPKNKMDIKY